MTRCQRSVTIRPRSQFLRPQGAQLYSFLYLQSISSPSLPSCPSVLSDIPRFLPPRVRSKRSNPSWSPITRAGKIETFSKTDDLQVVRLVSYSLKKIYRMMSCNREVCIQSRRISSYDQEACHATRVRLSCNQKGFLIARDGATPLPTLSYSKSKSWSPSLLQPRFSSQVQIALQIAISPLRSSRST